MTRALYIVGPPGAGKSTLIRSMFAGVALDPAAPVDARWPLVKGQHFDHGTRGGVLLGGDHPLFPGTDRLSMGVRPQALRWLANGELPDLIVGEGARLGNAGFLTALAAATSRLAVIHLDPPADVVARRRALRGTGQNEQWAKGATTGARNAAEGARAAGIDVLTVVGSRLNPDDLWQLLR